MLVNQLNFFSFLILLSFFQYSYTEPLKNYYPPIEKYRSGFLPVDSGHSIYWEESGNPQGVPILFIHGGPGAGTNAQQRQFFDPNYYRIILFDQRSCGKSTPFNLVNNTTWDLVNDIDSLRAFLNIDRMILFGGSWGTTLALTYSIIHPEHVDAIILRGIFLSRQKELDWFYKEGANRLSPAAWELFLEPIPIEEREDLIAAYAKRLSSDDPMTRKKAAAAWILWEYANSKLHPDFSLLCLLGSSLLYDYYVENYGERLLTMAKIENHYFKNRCFFKTENWILENVHTISHIPTFIVQGLYDWICPIENALELHQALPNSMLTICHDSGHSADEPEILDALIRTTDSLKK